MKELEKVFLLPGEYSIVRQPTAIGTLLGSCVSVCVSNAQRGIAAMNHFLLPTFEGHDDLGKYGDTSTEKILEALFEMDRDPTHYHAQLFGGAHVLGVASGDMHIGQRNIEIAREQLRQRGIAIAREETGGTRGRRIDFRTDTQKVEFRLLGSRPVDLGGDDACVRVLVVEPSKLSRRVIRTGLESSGSFRIVGEADDAGEAAGLILACNPDVITLDVDVRRLDGLRRLLGAMQSRQRPVVVVAEGVQLGSAGYGAVLELGAFGVVDKKRVQLFSGSQGVQKQLVPLLRQAAREGSLPRPSAKASGQK